MYAVNAVYDGVNVKLREPVAVTGHHDVVVLFPGLIPSAPQEVKRPRSEIIGLLEGKVWMADDFNDPIDELKEYME